MRDSENLSQTNPFSEFAATGWLKSRPNPAYVRAMTACISMSLNVAAYEPSSIKQQVFQSC